jgi:predicted MFS family arabinose efflux permease
LQSLGFFVGGALGGWLIKHVGVQGLFEVCAVAMLAWLLIAWRMRTPPVALPPTASKAG